MRQLNQMVNSIIQLSNIMGEEVSASLEPPLSHLEAGAMVAFQRRSLSSTSSQILLCLEQALHEPRYDIAWITEDGQYMIITPMHIDPDSCEGRDIRTLVKLTASNSFEILTAEVVAALAAKMRSEIESELRLGDNAFTQHLSSLISKYLGSATSTTS